MNQNNYKCIRSYPGGPDVGYISKPKELNDELDFNSHYYNHYWFDPKLYPEDWELLVEKDYEIMSLKYKYQNGDIKFAFLQGNGNYAITSYMFYGKDYKYGSTLERCLATDWEIFSVKRLSDGDIFTINDKLDGFDVTAKISLFRIENDQMKVGVRECGIVGLNSCKHKLKPLFTTEDGVDIIEGDNFWFTSNVFDVKFWNSKIMAKLENNNYFLSNKPKFSTKEACLNYISDNKPQYSKKDMISFARYCGFHYEDIDQYFRDFNSLKI